MRTPQMQFDLPHRPRRSECAGRSAMDELKRLRSLSVIERIKSALTIQQRFAWLQPKPRNP